MARSRRWASLELGKHRRRRQAQGAQPGVRARGLISHRTHRQPRGRTKARRGRAEIAKQDVALRGQQFPTDAQVTKAKEVLASGWGAAVSG